MREATKARISQPPRLSLLTTVGLIGAGSGFLGASIDPGPGPRTVHGALTLGVFYLPPLLMALVALVIAALVAARARLSAIGAVFAAAMLVGSATLGADAMSYRLAHPDAGVGFAEDWLQLLGELLAAAAGTALTLQTARQGSERHWRRQRRVRRC